MRFASVLALALLSVAALAQPSANTSGGPLRWEQAAVDISYYDLDLEIWPADSTIVGVLSAHLRLVHPTDVLVFDLDDALDVQSVQLVPGAGAFGPLAFEREPGVLRIHLGRTYQPGEGVAVQIAYGGKPRVAPRPPWIGGFTWSRTADGQPWVGVSCQGEGADLWWPTKDHPSDEADSMRIALTVPAGLTAIANGRFIERRFEEACQPNCTVPRGRSRGVRPSSEDTEMFVWHVSNPINNYGVSAYVAPYATLDTAFVSVTGERVPFAFHVLPERLEDARRQQGQFLDHLAFLEQTFGPYPFRRDGYKAIHAPYLGMEHQSAIAYGDDFSNNEFGFDWLHFHELAHEWWANLLTASDWRDFWVHEGFAEYAEALYAGHIAERRGDDGPAAYRAYLVGKRPLINNADAIAPLPPQTTRQMYFDAEGGFDGDIYYKGAWFLHTLRWTVGDEAFFTALRRLTYPDSALEGRDDCAACRFVSTDDVRAAFEAASGLDLRGAFAAYLRQPALPRLVAERTADRLALRWEVPPGALLGNIAFEVPVEVEAAGVRHRVPMPGGVGTLALPPSADYRLDPDEWLLVADGVGG